MKSEPPIVWTALLVCNAEETSYIPFKQSSFFVTNSLYPGIGSLYSQGQCGMISLIVFPGYFGDWVDSHQLQFSSGGLSSMIHCDINGFY